MIQKILSSSIMPFSSSNHFLYFAFGSNLLTERIHIKNPSDEFKCVAKLDRYKLAFNHFSEVSIIWTNPFPHVFFFRKLKLLFQRWKGSAATIMEDENSHLYGIVWELHNDHLKTLDDQEGVPLKVYKRIKVKVLLYTTQLPCMHAYFFGQKNPP